MRRTNNTGYTRELTDRLQGGFRLIDMGDHLVVIYLDPSDPGASGVVARIYDFGDLNRDALNIEEARTAYGRARALFFPMHRHYVGCPECKATAEEDCEEGARLRAEWLAAEHHWFKVGGPR